MMMTDDARGCACCWFGAHIGPGFAASATPRAAWYCSGSLYPSPSLLRPPVPRCRPCTACDAAARVWLPGANLYTYVHRAAQRSAARQWRQFVLWGTP